MPALTAGGPAIVHFFDFAILGALQTDRFGNKHRVGRVGVSRDGNWLTLSSSQGTARRARMWSTATLRATRRIHAANGERGTMRKASGPATARSEWVRPVDNSDVPNGSTCDGAPPRSGITPKLCWPRTGVPSTVRIWWTRRRRRSVRQ